MAGRRTGPRWRLGAGVAGARRRGGARAGGREREMTGTGRARPGDRATWHAGDDERIADTHTHMHTHTHHGAGTAVRWKMSR